MMSEPTTYPWESRVNASFPKFLQDYSYTELADLLLGWGFKQGNLDFLFTGLHRRGYLAFDQFQPQRLPRALIERLSGPDAPPLQPFTKISAYPSSDQSIKYVFSFARGGEAEAVYMPVRNRITLCISSQIGCAMGCTFCATGTMGFRRHLSPAEMEGQVLHMLRENPHEKGKTKRVNVVFMGMGEPLHNLDGVLDAFHLLTHSKGLGLFDQDVAVSTSGLVPKIEKLAKLARRPLLMVSIAATRDEARSGVMPVNRAYPLETLLRCLERYPLRRNERIMLSYVLIAGVNDTPADVEALSAMSRRFPSIVNVIPMNAHEGSPGMDEPEEDHLQWFYGQLVERRVFATIRRSKGRDVAGGCGQLVTRLAV